MDSDEVAPRTGLTLKLPPLKGGKVASKAQKDVKKPKAPRPVKLKPLKEVLMRLINQIKRQVTEYCSCSLFAY